MQQLAAESGATYFDANTQPWRSARDRFHDPDHLSATGNAQLSEELCTVLAPMLATDE